MLQNLSDKDARIYFRQSCNKIFQKKCSKIFQKKCNKSFPTKMQQTFSYINAIKSVQQRYTYIYKITNLHLCRSNSRRHCVLGLLISHILLKITQCAKQHTHYEKKHREKHILKKVLGVNIGYVVITFVPRNRKLNTFSKALNRI